MTQTTTWELVAADYNVEPTDGLDEVVTKAHWQCIATDDTKPGVVGRTYGMATLGAPDPTAFVTRASLTQAQILGWAQAALGADTVASQTAAALAALNRLITPPTASFLPAS